MIGTVARMTGDVGLAEDAAQDAVLAALERWPATGVPPNPGAWLTATAKHRAIDVLRRTGTLQGKYAELARDADEAAAPDLDAALDDAIGDDVLSLMFTCCHPVLSADARVALTLRMLGGLGTAEIARAYLVPEPTVGQRIVRAKRALADAHVPFAVPSGDELAPRLASVLEVVYLIFNEGYAATAGDDWLRPGAARGGAAARPRARPPRARGARGPRAAGADGAAGLARGGAQRARRRADPARRPGPARAGTGC